MSNKIKKDYAGSGIKELYSILADNKKELLNLRFQSASGELSNTSRFKQVRKDIARVSTAITSKKLGDNNA